MKKLIQTSVCLLCMFIQCAFAANNNSQFGYCITIVNNSNDDYAIDYIYQPNPKGRDWSHSLPLHPGAEQPFCYQNPPNYGIYFKIIKINDNSIFYYGPKSKGSIVIPTDGNQG